jgi:hypothetical protein
MSGLSADKIARVSALMASLPGDMAERMCAAARKADPALGRLLDYCRDGPDASARRLFFAPLADVSGEPGEDRPSRAYAPASAPARGLGLARRDRAGGCAGGARGRCGFRR